MLQQRNTDMSTVTEIANEIKGLNQTCYLASAYTMVGDVLVRVSNHLPKVYNLEENNEGVEKLFLIFTECDLTERQIENYIESDLHRYQVSYMLVEEGDNYDRETIMCFINMMAD